MDSDESLRFAIVGIIFWQFAVFPCKFVLPQVRWDLISGIKNIEYKLVFELQNDLKLRIPRN